MRFSVAANKLINEVKLDFACIVGKPMWDDVANDEVAQGVLTLIER